MNTTTNHAYTRSITNHYVAFQGAYSSIFEFKDTPKEVLNAIYVLEFPPPSSDFDWLYATVGMGALQEGSRQNQYRTELIRCSRSRQAELATVLAKLVIYPVVHCTSIGIGHTIAGTIDEGIVEKSVLTDFLITPIYFEAEGFDIISIKEGEHIHILWATPISRSERKLVQQQGWRFLIEELFTRNKVQPADLWRSSVV